MADGPVRGNRLAAMIQSGDAMNGEPVIVAPYSALAAGYDVVMSHVDYEGWAEYVLDLLAEHAPGTRSIIELGCGTGTLALEIQERAVDLTGEPGGVDFLGTDASEEMIRVARAKASMAGKLAGRLRFEVADFLELEATVAYDAVLLLYDGLNYLLEENEVGELLSRIADLLKPGGVAIIDQSTPANSLNNADYFGDEGEAEGLRYIRRSRYEPALRHHITEFDIVVEGERFVEHHVQRAYTIDEIQRLIEASPLTLTAAYDEFSFDPAGERTERIHWVLRKGDS
jgi:SAM-dependent methyltransferase